MGKMNAYIALLRAVNVGGTGKLPMAELQRMRKGNPTYSGVHGCDEL
jgi:uncharacterized protein (DUF1697 family)